MSQETSDLVFGAVGLAIFMAVVFVLGYLLNRFKNARFARAWQPLIPVIGGTVVEDGGGAVTSWLTGQYGGRRVQASTIPSHHPHLHDSDRRFNYFEVELLDVTGKHNWRIFYKNGALGMDKTGWDVQSEDKALEGRIRASGIIEEIVPFYPLEVEFTASTRILSYGEVIAPEVVPAPGRFRQELDLLLKLAAFNVDVNSV